MKERFARFRKSTINKITNIKNRAQNGGLKFQENLDEAVAKECTKA